MHMDFAGLVSFDKSTTSLWSDTYPRAGKAASCMNDRRGRPRTSPIEKALRNQPRAPTTVGHDVCPLTVIKRHSQARPAGAFELSRLMWPGGWRPTQEPGRWETPERRHLHPPRDLEKEPDAEWRKDDKCPPPHPVSTQREE